MVIGNFTFFYTKKFYFTSNQSTNSHQHQNEWIDESIMKELKLLFCLCGSRDQNSANICPCVCRKRQLTKGYKLSYTTGLFLLGLFACSAVQCSVRVLGSWALSYPDSGNILFQRLIKKSKVFYGQEPPRGESTTTECGFNY